MNIEQGNNALTVKYLLSEANDTSIILPASLHVHTGPLTNACYKLLQSK